MVSHSTPMWMVYYHDQTDQSSGSLMVPNVPSQLTTLPDFTSQTVVTMATLVTTVAWTLPELRNFFGRQSWVGAWKINTVKYQSSLKRSCQIRCTSIHIQTYCKIASVKTIESKIVKDHYYGTKRLVWITTAVGLASYQWWMRYRMNAYFGSYIHIYIHYIYTHT